MKCYYLSLGLNMSVIENVSQNQNRILNNADSDGTPHYEPSVQGQHIFGDSQEFYSMIVAFSGYHPIWVISKTVTQQHKIFRRKRLSTGANFVHVYIEIWDEDVLKFNKFSLYQVKSNNNVIL